jgi:hypothetical protein
MKLGFGIPVIGPAVGSAVGLSAFCRGLEDLGYDSLWVADRLAAAGHLLPLVPLADAAADAGHDVAFLTGTEMAGCPIRREEI